MVLKFRESFISKGALAGKPTTVVVEAIEAKEFKGISIESLEGSYSSPEEFDLAYKRHSAIDSLADYKIYNFIPMTLKTAITLRDLLTEAIDATNKGD